MRSPIAGTLLGVLFFNSMRRLGQLFSRADEGVGAGRQAQLLGGQAADALAVHGQLNRAGGGNDPRHARRLDLGQDLRARLLGGLQDDGATCRKGRKRESLWFPG